MDDVSRFLNLEDMTPSQGINECQDIREAQESTQILKKIMGPMLTYSLVRKFSQ